MLNQYLLGVTCFARPWNYEEGRLSALTGWLKMDSHSSATSKAIRDKDQKSGTD